MKALTFQRADTLPNCDDDTGHVQHVSGHLERATRTLVSSHHRGRRRHHHHHHHLERERLVELWRHVTLDDVSSSRLDDDVLAHHTHLGVEVCT